MRRYTDRAPCRLLLVPVALVILPWTALGQPAFQLEPITITATRQEKNDFDVATAMTIVDETGIRAAAPSVLSEALRGEAGVFVQATTPGQAAPIVRGLIGSGTLLLVDGMRLNAAIFRSAPNQYSALVDPYNADRIEIARGAKSTLYGSDAMGGVVQVLTREPRFDSETWAVDGDALTQFSSADLGLISHAAVAGGRKGFSVSGGMTYQNHDDLRTGGGTSKPSAYSSYAGNVSVLVNDDDDEVLLAAQYLQQPKTPRYDELVPGYGQTQPNSAVFSFEPNDRLFTHARYRRKRPFDAVERLEVHAGYQQINDDRVSRDYAGPNRTREDHEKNRSDLVGLTLQLTSQYREIATLTYGGEIYLDHTQSSRYARNIETGAISDRPSRFADGSTMNSYGLYLQNEMDPLPKLTVTLGGRFSYYDLDLPGDATRPPVHLSYHDLTGSLGLLYRLTENLHLVSNLGRAFRVPNVFDLSTLGNRPGNRFGIPNPDLQPEQVVSVDAGTKILFERVHGELFGFYSLFDDRIEDVATGETTADGRIVVRSENFSNLRLAGVEASADALLLDELKLYSTLTYTWGELSAPGGATTPADRIPPLNGRVGLSYSPTQNISVDVFSRFAAEQNRLSPRDETDPRIDPNGTAGWATANLRLRWSPTDSLDAGLLIENLGDTAYREHGSGIDAPGINVIASIGARL